VANARAFSCRISLTLNCVKGLLVDSSPVCLCGLKRQRNPLLPCVEHAVADILELLVVFDVGANFLGGARNCGSNAFEYLPGPGRSASHARLA
jgi:hypothetical protein